MPAIFTTLGSVIKKLKRDQFKDTVLFRSRTKDINMILANFEIDNLTSQISDLLKG